MAVRDPAQRLPSLRPVHADVRRRQLFDLLVVLAVPAAVVGTWLWGNALTAAGRRLFLGAAPFHGTYDPRLTAAAVVPLAVVGVVVATGPGLAERLRWRWATALAAVVAAAWALALAAVDGLSAIAAPLTQQDEYLADVGRVGSLHTLLSSYVRDLPSYHTHVRGHPPGPLLLLAVLDRIGLRGPVPAALLVIAAGASAVAAVATTIRAVAGEGIARRTLPFLVLLPAALWVATSLDALFLGVSAWATAAIAVAARRGGVRGVRGVVLAIVGGAGWGVALHLTYGVAPLGLLVVTVALVPDRRRTAIVLGSSAAGVLAVFGMFAAAGFNWFAGLAATHIEWARGAGPGRPWLYFAVANIAVAAVCAGPAVVAALTRRWPPGVARLVVPVLAALAAADAIGFYRGEVERIWLPFVFWLAAATAALPRRSVRTWLALQGVTAVTLQLLLRSRW